MKAKYETGQIVYIVKAGWLTKSIITEVELKAEDHYVYAVRTYDDMTITEDILEKNILYRPADRLTLDEIVKAMDTRLKTLEQDFRHWIDGGIDE